MLWQLFSVRVLRMSALKKTYIKSLNKYGLKSMISER